jgi:hypothetical protein
MNNSFTKKYKLYQLNNLNNIINKIGGSSIGLDEIKDPILFLTEIKNFMIKYYNYIHTKNLDTTTFTDYLKYIRNNLLVILDPDLERRQFDIEEALTLIFNIWFEKTIDVNNLEINNPVFPLGYSIKWNIFYINGIEDNRNEVEGLDEIQYTIPIIRTNVVDNLNFQYDNNSHTYKLNQVDINPNLDYQEIQIEEFYNLQMLTIFIERNEGNEGNDIFNNNNFGIQFQYNNLHLYSIICFSGNTFGGHYICYFKGSDNQWYLFNDVYNSIELIDINNEEIFNNIRRSCVYLVYYFNVNDLNTRENIELVPLGLGRYKNNNNSCYYSILWALLHKYNNPLINIIKNINFDNAEYINSLTLHYAYNDLVRKLDNYDNMKKLKSKFNLNDYTIILIAGLFYYIYNNYNNLKSNNIQNYIISNLCIIIFNFIITELDINNQIIIFINSFFILFVNKKLSGSGNSYNITNNSSKMSLENLKNKIINKIILIFNEWIQIPNHSLDHLKIIIEKNKDINTNNINTNNINTNNNLINSNNIDINNSKYLETFNKIKNTIPYKLSSSFNNKVLSIIKNIEYNKYLINQQNNLFLNYTKTLKNKKSNEICNDINFTNNNINENMINNCLDKQNNVKEIKIIFNNLLK